MDFQVALDGRWLDWRGLPLDADEPTLLESLGVGPERVRRGIGRLANSQFETGLITRPSAPTPVRWWHKDGQVRLVELVDPPSSPGLDDVLAGLGAPEREGSGRFLVSGATTTEYVWPQRGLALTVAESYDDPPTFPPRLASAQVFEPTSLRDFVIELGGNDRRGPSW